MAILKLNFVVLWLLTGWISWGQPKICWDKGNTVPKCPTCQLSHIRTLLIIIIAAINYRVTSLPAQVEEPADVRQKILIAPISGISGCQMQQVSLQNHRFQNSGIFKVPQNFSSLIKSLNHQLYPENIPIPFEFLYSVPLKVKFK